MKGRTFEGIIVGMMAWWLQFYLPLGLTVLLWPDLREASRVVRVSGDYTALTTGMLAVLLASYVYINAISGWIAARISGHLFPVVVFATPIVAYAAFQHFHVLWNHLPSWYNLGVVGFIYPFTLAGGVFARRTAVA